MDDQTEEVSPEVIVSGEQQRRRDTTRATVQALPKQVRNLLAGGMAGMVAKSVVAPVDRIKILFQTSNARFSLTKVPTTALKIVKHEGLAALWKGNTATMVRVFPYSGIQFMTFDFVKQHFLKRHRDAAAAHSYCDNVAGSSADESRQHSTSNTTKHFGLSPIESFVAGSVAGAVSVALTYPLDLTRAQLAVLKRKKHHQHNAGFIEVLLKNYKRGGIPGLFRGITPTMLGIFPYSGVAFAINEQAKRYIVRHQHREPTTLERMQCGALSGLCAQTMTYPLEVTRRRMQTIGFISGTDNAAVGSLDNAGKTVLPRDKVPVSMLHTMQHLLEEQGWRGFFKGVSMNWLKGPIAFSISFTTFDIVQGWLETQEEHTRRTAGKGI